MSAATPARCETIKWAVLPRPGSKNWRIRMLSLRQCLHRFARYAARGGCPGEPVGGQSNRGVVREPLYVGVAHGLHLAAQCGERLLPVLIGGRLARGT